MEDLGLTFTLTAHELQNINSRDGLLLMMYLFQNLPQYMPKTTISFVGALGQPIRKNIELRNPAKKKIFFNVALEGCADFRVEKTTVELPPRGTVSLLQDAKTVASIGPPKKTGAAAGGKPGSKHSK